MRDWISCNTFRLWGLSSSCMLILSYGWSFPRTRDTQKSMIVATHHPLMQSAYRINKSVRGFCRFLDIMYQVSLYKFLFLSNADSLLTIRASHQWSVATAFESARLHGKGYLFLYGSWRCNVVVVIEMGAYIHGCFFLWVPFLLILQYVIYFGAHAHSSKFKSKILIEAF